MSSLYSRIPRHITRLCMPINQRFFAIQAFKLPDIGEGITEVQVMEWFVKEGDRVKEMDRLCLVESDKASVEITSRFHGVIKSIKAPPHEVAKVGSVIVEIDDETESAGTTHEEETQTTKEPAHGERASPKKPTEEQKPSSSTAKPSNDIKAAPSVRALAKLLVVELREVEGTGKEGRITEEDVQRHSKKAPSTAKPSKHPKTEFTESLDMYGPSKQVKLSQVGLGMVKSMNESLKVPQLTHSDELDCGRLMDMLKVLKPMAMSEYHLSSLTMTAFLIKAVSLAIEQYPLVNSRMSPNNDAYHLLQQHNVSVAMDSPRGLVVPNIRNVESLGLVEVQQKLTELTDRAKAGRLSFDDIRGGTISLSNIGVIGGTYTKPVIFDGQAVIGCVGRAVVLPRYNSMGALCPTRIMNVSWTADHRHVDGASVARFSNIFKEFVENPELLISRHFLK